MGPAFSKLAAIAADRSAWHRVFVEGAAIRDVREQIDEKAEASYTSHGPRR
jgi:hypothetical protein